MELRNRRILVLGVLLALGSSTCRQPEKNGLGQGAAVPGRTIEQVLNDHTDQWMAVPGVVGTAIGECKGKPCILILTAANTEQVRRRIPATVEGYPVVIQHTGEIHALDQP
jgi:hypothetical protein